MWIFLCLPSLVCTCNSSESMAFQSVNCMHLLVSAPCDGWALGVMGGLWVFQVLGVGFGCDLLFKLVGFVCA